MGDLAVCVLGIGSPHGSDQVGWRVVELYNRRRRHTEIQGSAEIQGSTAVEAIVVREPLEAVEHLRGRQCAVLVDACQMGTPAGTVVRLNWPDRRIEQYSVFSSHGFGVSAVLKLAESLRILPQRVVLYGIEITDHPLDASQRTAVELAISETASRIQEELDRLNEAKE